MSSVGGMMLEPAVAAAPALAPADLGGSYGGFLLQVLLSLVLVCGLAYVVVRYGARRWYGGGVGGKGPLRVLARLPLEPRRTLYLVEAAGKTLLVGVGEQGPMTTLAELEPGAVEAALTVEATRGPTGRRFLDVLRGRRAANGD